MTEFPDALNELRQGNRVRLSSSDNIQPPFHTTTMFAYKVPTVCDENAIATFNTTIAPQLQTSLLRFVEASCPHLSCVGYRDLTEGGIMYLEGPFNGAKPMFSSAVVDDWAPSPQDLYNGHMTNFPFSKLLWGQDEVEQHNKAHSNAIPPPDNNERKFFPPLVKVKACLCCDKRGSPSTASSAYVTIVLEIYHEVCDACSLSMFAKGWSAFYNAQYCGGDATPTTFTIAPHLLRGDILAKTAPAPPSSSFKQELNAPFPNGFHFFDVSKMPRHNLATKSTEVVYSTVRLRFKNSDIQQMQDQFNAEHPILVEDADGKKVVGGKYSKNDILVAMNWKAMYAAAKEVHLTEDLYPCAFLENDGIANGGPVPDAKRRDVPMVKITVPIALRGKLPGVDASFLGNALRAALCIMPLEELLSKPLHEIAAFVHLEVRKCASLEHVKQTLTWLEEERPLPRVGGMFLGSGKCPSLTSWVHYNLYDAKFNLFNLDGAAVDELCTPHLASVVRPFQIPNLGVLLSTPPALVAKEANVEDHSAGIDLNVCLATVQLEAMLKMDYFVGRVVGTQL